jgi:hypothetical protein
MSRRFLAPLLFTLALLAGAAHAEPRALERAPASFRAWLESLPEGQQRMAERRIGAMPEHRRHQLFQRWEALEEGERRAFQQRMVERLERGERMRSQLEQMPPEKREKLAPLVRRWRDMGPADRRRMRMRLERFRTLSPKDQEALIERRFENNSPEERARILESLREASKALSERPLLDPKPPEPAPSD